MYLTTQDEVTSFFKRIPDGVVIPTAGGYLAYLSEYDASRRFKTDSEQLLQKVLHNK